MRKLWIKALQLGIKQAWLLTSSHLLRNLNKKGKPQNSTEISFTQGLEAFLQILLNVRTVYYVNLIFDLAYGGGSSGYGGYD